MRLVLSGIATLTAFLAIGFISFTIERKIIAQIQSRTGPTLHVSDPIKIFMKRPSQRQATFFSGILFLVLGSVVLLPWISVSHMGFIWLLFIPLFLTILLVFMDSNDGDPSPSAQDDTAPQGTRHLSLSLLLSSQLLLFCSLASVFFIVPSWNLIEIARSQSPVNWNLFHNPFIMVSGFLVLGVYSTYAKTILVSYPSLSSHSQGIPFAIFHSTKYLILLSSAVLFVILYLGGFELPLIPISVCPFFLQNFLYGLSFLIKLFLIYGLFMWVGHALPFSHVKDQANFYWRLTPIAFLSLLFCTFWMILFRGQSLLDLVRGLW